MKCALIYNPNSGKNNKKRKIDYIKKRLGEKFNQVDVFGTQRPGHATDIAKLSCLDYDVVVVVGGDGTLSEVVNGIACQTKRPAIGYIPMGTVNDVGHSIGLPRNPRKAVDIILNGRSQEFDIFRANGKYGFYVCCAGVFTETSYSTQQETKRIFGRLAYAIHAMKKMFATPTFNIELEFDGGKINTNLAFLLILNSRNVAGIKVNSSAKLNDGYVDILLVKDRHKHSSISGIFRVLSMFLFGLRGRKNITRLRLDKFKIQVPAETVINIDGEKAFRGGFEFETIKRGIKIFVK